MYALLPNTRVPFKPAAIGASITGAIWVGFILSFIVYVKSFANGTFAVYGALAAFPIFLLLLYASIVIILYGAEVSYMMVYIEGYIKQKRVHRSINDLSVYAGLRILFSIFGKFEQGNGGTNPLDIQKLCERDGESEYYLNLFRKNNIIMDAGNGLIVPATSSDMLKMTELIDLVHDATLVIPSNIPNDNLKKHMGKIFEDMNTSRKNIIGNLTLGDIVKEKTA